MASSNTPTYHMRATLEGLESEIFKLVTRSATPEQWAEWLRAPLEHAAAEVNLGLVDKLIGAGATVIAGWKGCGGRTLLHAAAVGGNEGVLSSLLRAGAQPDVNTLESPPSSLSPLYLATKCGHEAVARLLVIAGADVNFNSCDIGNFEEQKVLKNSYSSIIRGHERLAKELVMSGADVNTKTFGRATPLHYAAERGLNGVVSALLLRGADVDARDTLGASALMRACCTPVKEAQLAVIETLLAAGADLSFRSGRDLAALDYAAREGFGAIIQALVRGGADVNSRDDVEDQGCTALSTEQLWKARRVQ